LRPFPVTCRPTGISNDDIKGVGARFGMTARGPRRLFGDLEPYRDAAKTKVLSVALRSLESEIFPE
jgi:hypothetical protein